MSQKLITTLVITVVGLGVVFGISRLQAKRVPPKLAWPLEKPEQRDKKLTFGLFVTPDPARNPIDPPERFTGFHTALDLEILADEENKEVPVYAACPGKVLSAEEAGGYGGVVVHSCRIDNQDVTMLYGHLDQKSFKYKPGDDVKTGDMLGVLGAEKSEESGFNRKHLHFGIHKGAEVVLLGYVQDQVQLQNYIDPLLWLVENK
jgi:murein DD-endopeptidase MepM/ murein hydrolase activator NlpD